MCLVAVGFVEPLNTSGAINGFATGIEKNGAETALGTRVA